jgi:hypothetical protein
MISSSFAKSVYNNVDIKFSAHDAFMEEPSSDILNVENIGI